MSFDGVADLEQRLATRLDPLEGSQVQPSRGDFDLDPQYRPEPSQPLTPAAVLAPIVRRPQSWTLLLTLRTQTMPTHAGQIAFPGGRIQPNDSGPVAAAVRETTEETGIAPGFIHPIGRIDAYETGTGYAISPVVAYIDPGFTLRPDPREVDDVFEAPLSFLMDPANHQRHEREWRGHMRAYYAMPYNDRYIWGATAGMIRALYEKLYR